MMAAAKKAKDIMTTKVVTCGPKAKVKDAIGLLVKNKISGIVVVDDDCKVAGLLSEADVLLAAKTASVGSVMTAKVVMAKPDDAVKDIAAVLVKKKIKRVPIVDADGKLLGVVSRADVLQTMA
jgi:CBS domain-containing protein